jgi:DNA adenine methylase
MQEAGPPQARPLVKFVGGKTQLLPELRKHLPPKIRSYYEPFIGGGALFFSLAAEKRFRRAVINDANLELTRMYRTVRDVVSTLMKKLVEFENLYVQNPEEFYYALRNTTTSSEGDDVFRSARFIFLNKACFNGLYRVNSKGFFNVPWGKKPQVTSFNAETLTACSDALRDVEVRSGDFQEAVAGAGTGDVVYFDPPYLTVSDTAKFTAYTKGGFGPEEHCRLAEFGKEVAARGAKVIISNADTKEAREIFRDGYKLHKVEARRNVNSVGGKRGKVGELICVAR